MRASEIFSGNIISEASVNDLITPEVLEIVKVYKDAGYSIRMVGGSVRDLYTKDPIKDRDFSTDALPEESINLLKSKGYKVIPTGLEHGTITVVVEGEPFEITTLRMDAETDGRHAIIKPAKEVMPNGSVEDWWRLDAERRDLTYNAMSLDIDPNTGKTKVIDYFGGIDDISSGNVRFVGDADGRIKEDYLRILRLFRFMANKGGQIPDQKTKEAIKNNASGLKNISIERIWAEIEKTITGKKLTAEILKTMKDLNVDTNIGMSFDNIPEAVNLSKKGAAPITVLAKLMGVKDTKQLVDDWRLAVFNKKVISFLDNIETNEQAIMAVTKSNDPNIDKVYKEWLLFNNKSTQDSKKDMTFPIGGRDLISMGYKPGPNLGRMIEKIRRYWVENDMPSKEELLSKLEKGEFDVESM